MPQPMKIQIARNSCEALGPNLQLRQHNRLLLLVLALLICIRNIALFIGLEELQGSGPLLKEDWSL
jgi:hypothetical protein